MKKLQKIFLLSLLAIGTAASSFAETTKSEYPVVGEPNYKWVVTKPKTGTTNNHRVYGFAHKVPVNPAVASGAPITTHQLLNKFSAAHNSNLVLPTFDTFFTYTVNDVALNPGAATGNTLVGYNHIRVGTDPSQGGAARTVPVVFIPVVVTGPDGTVYDPRAHVFPGDTVNIFDLYKQSPLFEHEPINVFGNNYGTTQLLDAWVRAERYQWLGSNPNYHLWLAASTAAKPLVLTANAAQLVDLTGANLTGVQRLLNLDNTLFVNGVQAYFADPGNNIHPGVIPVFITDYNIMQLFGAGGYHDSFGLQTYIWNGSFVNTLANQPNVVVPYPRDGQILEHELAELIDHPYPSYDNGGPCYTYGYEVGDPLEFGQNDFTYANNRGITYRFQDLTLAAYNEGTYPSTAIGGRFTLGGTYSFPCSGL